MLYLFEISKKWPFRKGMGWGGVGGHIFEIRGRTFGHFGVFGVCTVCTCRLCPAPCAILLSRPLFVAQVHFSCCFLSATMPPKGKRLILGSPSPKKRKLSPNDKLVGRQYHFYKGISRRTLMEAIPYERQQTLLADMHNNIDEDIFDFNDIRQRHTVQALLNCFLAFSEGSQRLARYLYDTVGDRLFGSKQDSFLDTILVDRLKDTITLLKKDTGPQGVAVVEVLCAAICPTNVEGSPVGVKRTPHNQSSKLVAARLDLHVDRVYAATARRNHWEQNTCNGEWLYLCKPGWTPSNCQGVTAAEVSAIQTLWRSPDISHQSATTKCMLGKKAGPKVPVRFINMKQKDAAKKVAAALPPRVLKDGSTKPACLGSVKIVVDSTNCCHPARACASVKPQ